MFDLTRDVRTLNMVVVIGEFTRKCLAIHVARRIRSKEALEVFADLMLEHSVPEHIRSDNGPGMVADELLKEAQVVIEHWRNHANTRRPHSALGYGPPAPEVVVPRERNEAMAIGQMAA